MSHKRRLDDLDHSLTARECAKQWLEELHAFGDLADYTAAVVAGPSSDAPLARVGTRAADAVRRAKRARPFEEVEEARRLAARDGAFYYSLAMDLIGFSEERRRIGGISWAMIANWRRADEAERQLYRGDADQALRLADSEAAWRRIVYQPLLDLSIEGQVRHTIEGRYFDGRAVSFPATIAALDGYHEAVEMFAGFGRSGVDGDERARLEPTSIGADATPIARARIEMMVDFARAQALDLIGETGGPRLLMRYVCGSEPTIRRSRPDDNDGLGIA